MDIRKMKYFISIAETLSFTKAAKQHYISQTANGIHTSFCPGTKMLPWPQFSRELQIIESF